jgi:hypothetical protein
MRRHDKKRKWMIFFSLLMLAHLIILYFAPTLTINEKTWYYPYICNFSGNIIAGVLGGFLFLFLALYIQADTDEKIDRISKITESRMRTLESEATIAQFERVMEKESYYDIRFPGVGNPFGLEYTMFPVRDQKTHKPTKKTVEADESYVVKIVLPEGFESMNPEDREKYKTSPIKVNTYYFCQFYKDSWHMGTESVGMNWYKFYLSGKVGPVQWGQSANQFMETLTDPVGTMKEIINLFLDSNGKPPCYDKGAVAGDSYRIYQNDDGHLFLRINDSLLKPMYFTNPPQTYLDEGWFFVIEDMWGYANGEKLKNIVCAIKEKLHQLEIEPQKIYWYDVEDKDFTLFE